MTRAVLALPPANEGMRIGLLGGSFNPPHPGHAHIARQALIRLQLDAVWLMVSPGNPLKSHDGLARVDERAQALARLVGAPRLIVTDFEQRLGTAYTARTLAFLAARLPGVRFVWIMGADALAGFHRWHRWRDIAGLLPMAVVDRPGWRYAALSSRAAIALGTARLDDRHVPDLADRAAPAWGYVNIPLSPFSSTALRGAPASRDASLVFAGLKSR
jgi:nicotinate-nucleotide adenylyltransferase